MKRLVKYAQVVRITWKAITSYPVDTWLGAGMTGFRMLLSLLLWQAIFTGREEVGGYTLPVMMTYALVASLLARLQTNDATAWQLASEVREGTFSKYLVLPVSVIGYFMSAGAGRWIYQFLANAAALAVWAVVFSNWLVFPPALPVGWMILLIGLGAVCMFLFNHAISLLSLKYKDVTGLLIMKNGIIDFLSGAMIPLTLLPAPILGILEYSPFYYVVYYPASLLLGKQAIQPALAVLILLIWCVILLTVSELWFRKMRHDYEGVGI